MQWHLQRKGEQFYRKAKSSGYRARSAYKLLEIQEKFEIIKPNNKVVDLGAAPGSWSQVALELVGENGIVFGVDIQPVLGLGGNFKFVRADVLKNKEKIISEVKRADVVLADLSPEFSGFRGIDIGVAEQLDFAALELAKSLLRRNGNFACKAFQGKGFEEFVKEAKKYFEDVKIFKPKASQKESAEVYVVGLKFRQ